MLLREKMEIVGLTKTDWKLKSAILQNIAQALTH